MKTGVWMIIIWKLNILTCCPMENQAQTQNQLLVNKKQAQYLLYACWKILFSRNPKTHKLRKMNKLILPLLAKKWHITPIKFMYKQRLLCQVFKTFLLHFFTITCRFGKQNSFQIHICFQHWDLNSGSSAFHLSTDIRWLFIFHIQAMLSL